MLCERVLSMLPYPQSGASVKGRQILELWRALQQGPAGAEGLGGAKHRCPPSAPCPILLPSVPCSCSSLLSWAFPAHASLPQTLLSSCHSNQCVLVRPQVVFIPCTPPLPHFPNTDSSYSGSTLLLRAHSCNSWTPNRWKISHVTSVFQLNVFR